MGVFEDTMQGLGMTPRTQQAKLVEFIRSNLVTGGTQFVQAGTGTGKSFAVLTTALEAARETGLPSIVVCPNNALIDQYVVKDAPRIQGVSGGDFRYIKGRSRYLCMNSRAIQKTTVGTRGAMDEYDRLTGTGKVEWADLNLDHTYGCPGSGECKSADVWQVADSCPLHGRHDSMCDNKSAPLRECGCQSTGVKASCLCRYYCGAFEARRLAEVADVVITNAHVLVWDYLVGQFSGGMAYLLPPRGALFIDECHEFEAVARACQSDEIKPGSRVYDYVEGLQSWADTKALEMIEAKQSEGLLGRDAAVVKMAGEAKAEADRLYNLADGAGVDPDTAKEYIKEADGLMRFVDFVAESDQHISTIELQPVNPFADPVVHLKRTCVDTAMVSRNILCEAPATLVSGTIPASEPRRLGVADLSKIEDVGHPFDYSKSRLVISNHRGNDPGSTYARAEQVARAINSTNGGALILFTSWADLEAVVPLINMNLKPELQREFYVQNKENPAELKQDVEDFKNHGSSVLAGVRTLFTGLDIPGPALRNVILWKLPYAVPTLEMKAIERIHGKEIYWDAMKTVMVQGIGRLVRTTDDSGLVFIADSRANSQRPQWRANHMTAHLTEFAR